tara:strand:- start:211 stop:450 length:240 start_codon:yes stop_codon:yes gene_type:complete
VLSILFDGRWRARSAAGGYRVFWIFLALGFFHGFGLSSKTIEYNISPDGLVANLLAFNVGVEIGQNACFGGNMVFPGRL